MGLCTNDLFLVFPAKALHWLEGNLYYKKKPPRRSDLRSNVVEEDAIYNTWCVNPASINSRLESNPEK